MPFRSILTASLAAFFLLSCVTGSNRTWTELQTDPRWETGPAFHLKGTVRWQTLEGGFFAIIDNAGKRYEPTNLPKEFQVDKRPVEAEVQTLTNYVSVTMSGPGIQIVRIR